MRVSVIVGRLNEICNLTPNVPASDIVFGGSAGCLLATVIVKSKKPLTHWQKIKKSANALQFNIARSLRGGSFYDITSLAKDSVRILGLRGATLNEVRRLAFLVHDLKTCRAQILCWATHPQVTIQDALVAALAWPGVSNLVGNQCDVLLAHSFRDVACLWGRPPHFAMISKMRDLPEPFGKFFEPPRSGRLPRQVVPFIVAGRGSDVFTSYVAGLIPFVLGVYFNW